MGGQQRARLIEKDFGTAVKARNKCNCCCELVQGVTGWGQQEAVNRCG